MADSDQAEAVRAKRARLEDIRSEYRGEVLISQQLPEDPLVLFQQWFDTALEACAEPNAMVLSTVGPSGPSSRVVLLKGADENGLRFYTNYNSRKAKELAEDARAALNFFWVETHRQVRVEGVVERTSPEVSDEYFAARPRGSQLGAWASDQSAAIDSRGALEESLERHTHRFAATDDVPRPPHWGGFQLSPSRFEFWQGQPNRLHDRALYQRCATGWQRSRLAP